MILESGKLRLRLGGIEENGGKEKVEIVNFSIRIIRLERKSLRHFILFNSINSYLVTSKI